MGEIRNPSSHIVFKVLVDGNDPQVLDLLRGKPGDKGDKGDRGEAANPATVRAEVTAFLLANPPPPGQQGDQGDPGPKGDKGDRPSRTEIQECVNAYLLANPPPAGPRGADVPKDSFVLWDKLEGPVPDGWKASGVNFGSLLLIKKV